MQINSKKMSRFINKIYNLKLNTDMVLLYNNNTLYALSLYKDNYSNLSNNLGYVYLKNNSIKDKYFIVMVSIIKEHPFKDYGKNFFIEVNKQLKDYIKNCKVINNTITINNIITNINKYNSIELNFDYVKYINSPYNENDEYHKIKIQYKHLKKAINIGYEVLKRSDSYALKSHSNLSNIAIGNFINDTNIDIVYSDGRMLYSKTLNVEHDFGGSNEGDSLQLSVELYKKIDRLKINDKEVVIICNKKTNYIHMYVNGYVFITKNPDNLYFNVKAVIPEHEGSEVTSHYMPIKKDRVDYNMKFIHQCSKNWKKEYNEVVYIGRGYIVDMKTQKKVRADVDGCESFRAFYLDICSDVFKNGYTTYSRVLKSINNKTNELYLIGCMKMDEENIDIFNKLTPDYDEVVKYKNELQSIINNKSKNDGIFLPLDSFESQVDYIKSLCGGYDTIMDNIEVVEFKQIENNCYVYLKVDNFPISIYLGNIISNKRLPKNNNTIYFIDNNIDIIFNSKSNILSYIEKYSISNKI